MYVYFGVGDTRVLAWFLPYLFNNVAMNYMFLALYYALYL